MWVKSLQHALKLSEFAFYKGNDDLKQLIIDKCVIGRRENNVYDIDDNKFWSEIIMTNEGCVNSLRNKKIDTLEELCYRYDNWVDDFIHENRIPNKVNKNYED